MTETKKKNFLTDLDFLLGTIEFELHDIEGLEEDLYLATPVEKPTLLRLYTGENYDF